MEEREWEKNFDLLIQKLHWMAERGLGWYKRRAQLGVELDADHLRHLSPEEIFSWHPQHPNLSSILVNLVDNCGDHAFRLDEDLEVTIKSEREEEAVFAEVRDNGPGVSHLGQQRMNAVELARDHGSNLYIACTGARGLGGKIFAENIFGDQEEVEGARFTIELPVSREP
jgi:sensor histidine kinase regulating citrate/malate metabolism